MWPWSTIRGLRAQVDLLKEQLRIEQKISATAIKQSNEWRSRAVVAEKTHLAPIFEPGGGLKPGTPLLTDT